MFCHKCGTKNDDNNRFCGACGTALVTNFAHSQTNQQPPAQQALPPYDQQSPMQTPVNQTPDNGMAIASLVLGISSIVLFWLGWLALIAAIVGVVIGSVAINKANKTGASYNMAKAGVICSWIGIVLIISLIIIAVWNLIGIANDFTEFLNDYNGYYY